ncbi:MULTISPECIES: hypothetical protein [unclassified Nocardioides]|uniref:hypothetical protein n=1 Tax=unclassified Nocardioides TaxID=2615069 RepID=UPI0000EB6264|nr:MULTISPECIES: hypothetical protein [unclassified Nocardioides]ABL81715.1 putative transcriptional regulator [Nocardioides sp. JS614]
MSAVIAIEPRVVGATKDLGPSQGGVSGTLACRRDRGLIVGRPGAGRCTTPSPHTELIDLLCTAELLLALTGEAVELCPTYGPDDIHTDTDTETTPTSTTEEVEP